MTSISISALRDRIGNIASRAEIAGERGVVRRRGKPVCAVVSTEDLAKLEAMEDKRKLAIARKRLGGPTRPLEDVLRDLGIQS